VARVGAISATLAEFEGAGCTVADQLLACVVTIPPEQSEGVPHRARLWMQSPTLPTFTSASSAVQQHSS
jgi:hypothetical protein